MFSSYSLIPCLGGFTFNTEPRGGKEMGGREMEIYILYNMIKNISILEQLMF